MKFTKFDLAKQIERKNSENGDYWGFVFPEYFSMQEIIDYWEKVHGKRIDLNMVRGGNKLVNSF